jgi:hypothetical protein
MPLLALIVRVSWSNQMPLQLRLERDKHVRHDEFHIGRPVKLVSL